MNRFNHFFEFGGVRMKRLNLSIAAAFALAMPVIASSAFAQSAGSFAGDFQGPQGVAKVFTQTICSSTDSGCIAGSIAAQTSNLLTATVKASGSSSKSLLIMGSLEDGLTTETSNSGGGNKSSSTGTASIVVTPVVTGSGCPTGGCPVYPNSVTFASRTQTLTANLGSCSVSSSVVGETFTCTDTDTIDLLLSTTSANTFNFIVPNLSAGQYQVALAVAITTSATSDSLSAGATASAVVDAGSLGILTVQTQTPFNSLNFSN
jgi:hypothetical protein